MYVRIGTFDAPPAQMDDLVALFRGHVVDAFSGLDGFVGISKWTTCEALLASADTARRSRDEAEALGARWTGEPQILEAAFETRRQAR